MAIEFTTETRSYVIDGIADAEGATDIEFYNAGNSVVTVNSRAIQPNASWQINGFPFEKNTGRYRFTFVGGTGLLVTTRRTYKSKK
jgi:hypothetical protein